MKKKKIKIKHRKYSLYQRKKSTGRKVLTVILMVVIVAALVVVGYGVGRPLMEYLSGKNNTSEPSSAWTPPVSAETQGATSEGTRGSSGTTEPTQEDQAASSDHSSVFVLQESALASSEALNSALAAVRGTGCTDIAVTMKDESGNFLYKTNIKDVPEEQITGTLSAEAVVSLIRSAGFTPRARINTLLDRTTQSYADENICYMIADGGIWHDFYVDRGGKSWLDPFNSGTAKYLAAVTSELSSAGFSSIALANMKYPAFNNQDYSNFLRDLPIADDSARLEALWNVITACKRSAGDAEVLLEVSADELLSESQALTSAEPAGDRTKLKTVTLLVDYDPGDKPGYTDARAFLGRLSAMFSGQTIAVRLPASGFSESSLSEVRRAFSDAGVTVYSE